LKNKMGTLRKIVNFRRRFAKIIQKMIPMEIELDRVLLGQQVGKRNTQQWCSDINSPLSGSLSIKDWPHVKLLNEYLKEGDALFEPQRFRQTDYFKNAWQCILTYHYYTWCRSKEDIIKAARNFVKRTFSTNYQQEENLLHMAGTMDKASPKGEPVIVRRVKASHHLQACDGHHRLASAFVRGEKKLTGHINIWPQVYSPMQQLVLDADRQRGQENVWQPLEDCPEMQEWPVTQASELIAQCIFNYIKKDEYESFLDVNCGYGWFLNQFKQHGFKTVQGLESDPVSRKIGQASYGLNQHEIMSINSGQTFDITLCLNELEFVLKGQRPLNLTQYIESLALTTRHLCLIDFPKSISAKILELKALKDNFLQVEIIHSEISYKKEFRALVALRKK
jgi:hypothetical protein